VGVCGLHDILFIAMRAVILSIVAAMLSACSTQSVPVTTPHDHIQLSASGLMTPGFEMFIDLETGMVTVRTSRSGVTQAGHKPNWHKSTKRLNARQLQSLKDTIRRDVRDGLRSKACDEEDKTAKDRGDQNRPRDQLRTGEDDSMTSLDFQLEGHSGGAPERPCESPAFNDLWNAVYHASE